MCRVGVGWEPLDGIVERLVDGLTTGGAHEDTLTPADRHGPGRGSATVAILQFVPRKKDGPEPVQFPGGGRHQEGATNHLADDDSQTRGSAPLALRR
jgi:hypothetical protein